MERSVGFGVDFGVDFVWEASMPPGCVCMIEGEARARGKTQELEAGKVNVSPR